MSFSSTLSKQTWQQVAASLRALVRGSELWLVVLATAVGMLTGVAVTVMGTLAHAMHVLFFGIDPGQRLSAVAELDTIWRALVPAAGGLLLGVLGLILRRSFHRAIIDPVEANALHGGRMSLKDSLMLALQTLLSNGFGASIGLEAGFTQIGSALGSRLGRAFRLRRNDLRLLVGCGAAGAISAAFGAPLTGAFYAFELIIGVYSVVMAAPILAAAIVAYLTQRALGSPSTPIEIATGNMSVAADYVLFILVGFGCGLIGIGIMRVVTAVEALFRHSGLPIFARPIFGGLIIGGLSLITPQVLSGGHGALHADVAVDIPLATLALILVLKILASAVSIGSGFRGGLFFAALFMGTLIGKILAGGLPILLPGLHVDTTVAAVVVMAAITVAIVGGPLAMTFLALESTGDFMISGLVLVAANVSSITVRELFGYSFSTWRLHLRGETVRSAQDVGWIRSLTVGRMMQTGIRTVRTDAALAEFRSQFPLGATQRVVAVDEADRYAGIVVVLDAYAPEDADLAEARRVGDILHHRNDVLLPAMNIKQSIEIFDKTESEALVVVNDPTERRVLGLLSEAHALRRYSEELDQARRGLGGEP